MSSNLAGAILFLIRFIYFIILILDMVFVKKSLVIFIILLLGISFVSAEVWQEQESGTSLDLFSVDFIDEEEGWAVGGDVFGDSVILHTTNGGEEWIPQTSPNDEALYGVCFDGDYGFAVGSGNIILYTRNGGDEWLELEITDAITFWDVDCVDEGVAYAVGQGDFPAIKLSGEGWTSLGVDESYVLKGAHFVEEGDGYLVGENGVVLKVEDDSAGLVDTITRSDIGIALNEIYCLDMDTCKIVGAGQYVYTGSDSSWILEEAGTIVSSYWGVHYRNEESGWVSGQNTIRHIEDGEWLTDRVNIDGSESSFVPVNMVKDILFEGSVGYAVGDEGTILKYTTECLEVEEPECEEGEMLLEFRDEDGCVETYACVEGEEEDTCEEIEEPECADDEFLLEFYEDDCVVDYACVPEADEEDGCPEVDLLVCDEGDNLIEYTDENDCIIGYLCQISSEPYELYVVDDEETCQEQYRECLEIYPYNHAYCDGTYEFCDGLDEVLDEFVNKGGQEAAIYALVEESFGGGGASEYLKGEFINVFIEQKDGTQLIMGIKITKEGEFSVGNEALEDVSYTVYLSEDVINEFSNSEDFVKTLKTAVKDKTVEVKADGLVPKLKLTVIKLYLFFA